MKRERFATLQVGRGRSRRESPRLGFAQIDAARGRRIPSRRGRSSMTALMHGGQHHHAEPVRVGELQVWDVVNATGHDHPFHLHGFFFQVVRGERRAPPEFSPGKTP